MARASRPRSLGEASGQTITEYVLMMALMTTIASVVMGAFGRSIRGILQNMAMTVLGVVTGPP